MSTPRQPGGTPGAGGAPEPAAGVHPHTHTHTHALSGVTHSTVSSSGTTTVPTPAAPAQPSNRFLLLPLTSSGVPLEVPVGERVVLGRRSNASLNNLHISREQVVLELKPDATGAILICMTNRGKNSTRVLSIGRRKQARVTSNTYCRLVPGDVLELLYDQQGRYAYQLVEASPDGRPMLSRTRLVSSVSKYLQPGSAPAQAAPQGASEAAPRADAVDRLLSLQTTATGAPPDVDSHVNAIRANESAFSVAMTWARQWIAAAGLGPSARRAAANQAAAMAAEAIVSRGAAPAAVATRTGAVVGPVPSSAPLPTVSGAAPPASSSIALAEPLDPVPASIVALANMGSAASPDAQRVAVTAMLEELGLRRTSRARDDDEMEVVASSAAQRGAMGANDALEEWDEEDEDSDGRMAVDNNNARDDDDYSDSDVGGALRDAAGISSRSPVSGIEDGSVSTSPVRRRPAKAVGRATGSALRRVRPVRPVGHAVPYPSPGSVPAPTASDSAIELPTHLLPHILSCLPMHEAARASRVSREWRDEVRRSGAIPMVDIGAYFAGVAQPDPLVLDAIARTVHGRDYSFANCLWLTSGALLHAIGVPLGAVPTACLPWRPSLPHDADQSLRSAAATNVVSALREMGAAAVMPPPGAPRAPHSYLRHFISEITEPERNADPATGPRERADSKMDEDEVYVIGREPWWHALDTAWAEAVGSFTGATSAEAMSSMRWGSMDLGDVALVVAHGEVVRSRAVAQYSRMMSTSVQQGTPYSDAYGTIVASAYCEMSIACRVLGRRFIESSALLERVARTSMARELPALLNSGRNPLDALAIVGASTIFQPVLDMRRTAAAALSEALAGDPLVVQPGASEWHDVAIPRADAAPAHIRVPPRAVGLASRATADVLSEHPTVHALSACYATASADLFDFAHSLAAARARAEHPESLVTGDGPVRPGANVLRALERTALSHELPEPAATAHRRQHSSSISSPPGAPLMPNALGAGFPLTFATGVTGLDLHGCTRLAPQNLHLILSYCPSLTVLRLGGCMQFTSDLLVSVAPLLRNIQQLDLEYCVNVNDSVCAALGKHCPALVRLQLVGCVEITNDGLGPAGLLGVCTNLRRLNLRGCKNVGDEGMRHLARGAPHLRELCLAGLTQVTAPALADLILGCKKLTRFKAELWYDAHNQPPPHVLGPPLVQNAGQEESSSNRRSYRLLGSVRGAVRYLKQVLPSGDPTLDLLAARFTRDTTSNTAAGMTGGGAPLDTCMNGASSDDLVGAALRHGGGYRVPGSPERSRRSASPAHGPRATDIDRYGDEGGSASDDDGANDRFGATTNDVYMHHSIPNIIGGPGGPAAAGASSGAPRTSTPSERTARGDAVRAPRTAAARSPQASDIDRMDEDDAQA